MASNRRDSVDSTLPTLPQVGRGLFQGAWNTFKAVFNTHTADTPATQILDGIYVEVFDDMETAVVNSKMAGNKEHVEQKPVTNVEKKVYDLNFLLELGMKIQKAPHPPKFSSDAIKGNILKGSNVGKHKDPRTRGMSNVSKESTASDAEELLFKRVESEKHIEPWRQPVQPPLTSLAQVHAGFRKFLKEHSSPPGSRVTAGGRIVPVGPHGSAPPSLNPSSIADVIHGQAPAAQTVPGITGNVKERGRGGSSPTMGNVAIASDRQETQGNSQLSEASLVTAQANIGTANVYVPGFPTPLPFGAQVLMKLAHGPTLVTINGVLYEAISDGPNTILAHLHGFQQGAQLSPAPMLPAFPMVAPLPMASMQHLPLMNVTNNVPVAFAQAAVEVERQALQKQLDGLRVQLDQLDKHVALHRPQIGSYELSAVVAQRRQLVVQIDETRVAKENFDKQTQMNSRPSNAQVPQSSQGFGMAYAADNVQGPHFPGIGLPALSGGPHMYGAGFPVHAGIPVQNVATQLPTSHVVDIDGWRAQQTNHNTDAQVWQQRSSGTANPVFPSHHFTQHSNPPALGYDNAGWKANEYSWQQNFLGNGQGTGYEPTTIDHQSSAIGSNGQGPFQQLSNANVQGHDVTQSEFINIQPSYGLVHGQAGRIPYVSEEEASYATRLSLNPPNELKKYCSTPAEFAEVMRQARDHARLYGRVGVSSCDPQDDAEEDIRWAMLDDRRIPLPKAVPDYVFNPQPWDFETQYENFFKTTGSSLGRCNGEVHWEIHDPKVHGYSSSREHPAQVRPYAQAEAELSRATQYKAAYGQEATIPVSGPVKPASHQTSWAEKGNGGLTGQPKHAYVEDAPETPARYGFENGSLNGGSSISPAYAAMPNTFNLPTLDECDTEAKSKVSKAESIDSWATQSDYQPEYMRQIFRFEINGKEVSEQEARDNMIAEELAEKSAMTSSRGQNNQRDFLQTMLRDPRYSSTDSQTKSHEKRIEEHRQPGLPAAGLPIHYSQASSSVHKENQRSPYYSGTQVFQNVMAREREGDRVGGMQHFGGFASGTQEFPNTMGRKSEGIGGMQHFGGHGDSRMYKAGPSVGAPLYQARGHVVQYDGAMDSITSEVTASSEPSSEASSRRPSEDVTRAGTQVGLKVPINAMESPSSEATSSSVASSEESSRRSSEDVTLSATQAAATSRMNVMAPAFVYEPVRRIPAPAFGGFHYDAVDRFFHNIRAEERAEIEEYRARFGFGLM